MTNLLKAKRPEGFESHSLRHKFRSGSPSTPQRTPGSADCFLDIFVRVGGAEECCLELRCWQINPTIEHGAEEFAEGGGVGLRSGIPVRHRAFGEEPGEHRANAVEAQLHTSFFRGRGNALNQFGTERIEPRIDFALLLA